MKQGIVLSIRKFREQLSNSLLLMGNEYKEIFITRKDSAMYKVVLLSKEEREKVNKIIKENKNEIL